MKLDAIKYKISLFEARDLTIRPGYFNKTDTGFKYCGVIFNFLKHCFRADEIKFIISGKEKTKISIKRKNQIKELKVLINIDDLNILISKIGIERNKFSKKSVENELLKLLHVKKIDTGIEKKINLGNKISEIAANQDSLTRSDLTKMFEIISKSKDTINIGIENISKNKRKLDFIFLETVIREMEDAIDSDKNENYWQRFFREYILLFNEGYLKIIEKQNIGLIKIKIPDFLLLSTSYFLDIVELKRPSTNLLVKDKNTRNNYIWDKEINIGISQVENYLQILNSNAEVIASQLSKSLRILDLSIIRPRGFIIAGTSKLLEDSDDDYIGKKKNDFRILNDSLKNVEIILFDDYLKRLQNLLKILKENL